MPVARQDPTTTRRVSVHEMINEKNQNKNEYNDHPRVSVFLLDKGREHRRPVPLQRSRVSVRHNRPDGLVQAHMPLSAQHLRAQLREVLSGFRAEGLEPVQVRQAVRVRT